MDSFFEELLNTFKEEAEELLASWESTCLLLESDFSSDNLNELFRAAHTLKGSSKTVGLDNFGNFVHHVEDLIKEIKENPPEDRGDFIGFLLDCHGLMTNWLESGEPESSRRDELLVNLKNLQEQMGMKVDRTDQTAEKMKKTPEDKNITSDPAKKSSEKIEVVRVKRDKIDKMINFVGELGTQLTVLEHQILKGDSDSKESNESLEFCLKYIKLLQEYTISLSMQGIDRFMQRLERSCKDVARVTGKKINVEKIGTAIELDKTVLDKIADPFIHIVRNAADHGVEATDVRISSGKPPEGKIILQAVQKSDVVEFTVADDGAGLDKNRILEKAIEKGIVNPDTQLPDEAIYQLIMKPGFSTKQEVTEISGRGVGLDVVAESLSNLGGNLKIESEKGKGSKFIVSIPTNFSMVEAVLVDINGSRYAIPLKDFTEIIDLSEFDLNSSDNSSQFFSMRSEIVSIHDIRTFLKYIGELDEAHDDPVRIGNRAAIINRSTHLPIAFEIDKLHGRVNLFVKPLSGKLSDMLGVAGTAILPDGQAGLVLNLGDIAKYFINENQGNLNHG